MTDVSIQVEGLNAVIRSLRQMGVEVDDLKDAFSDIAEEGAQYAAFFAPKRTGMLATDIRGNRAVNKAVVTAGRAAVPYAGPINYGWPRRNIRASNFMQKASDVMEPRALDKLENAINRLLRERGLA